MPITLSSSTLQARVTPLGAELIALCDEEGRDLLWNGDPAFWTGRSPLLFPIVGRLRDDRTRIEGAAFSMRQHGFARTSEFELLEAGDIFCRLRLNATDATREQYPFEFRLDVTYKLEDSSLIMDATVFNLDSRPMPASFGFHPAFRWPLPYGETREAHEIRFEAPEPHPIRRPTPDGLIASRPHPTPVGGDRLVLRDQLFDSGAIVFDRVESRSVRYGAPGGRSITVSFPRMPHLGIWTKPGAGFVCIEPWQGHADPECFDGELADKPGIVLIPPGEAQSFEMEISLSKEEPRP